MNRLTLPNIINRLTRLPSKPVKITNPYKPGQKIHGYTVQQVLDIPELLISTVRLEHDRTGAKHIHAIRDDDDNLFSVALRTTPLTSDGAPHILEHTTLCGSKNYPVHSLFFKMTNRSLATFMNAMTANDWTMYPFSSYNKTDFRNLLSVYMDAVFYPELRELDFCQEGWRLEHEDANDPKSPIIYKGVVYNEMKGNFSSSASYFIQNLQTKLTPSHTYGVVSGGDPQYIPDLTWQKLKDFHSTYYHPSNSRFFTYGNFPLEDHLEFINDNYLQHFNKVSTDTAVPFEPRWTEPRRERITFAPDPLAVDPEKQTTISNAYLLADCSDSFESLVLSVISYLLINGESAPFYQSLVEANIGSGYSPYPGYVGHQKEGFFSIGLQGVRESDVEKVCQIIDDTINHVVMHGFPIDRVEGCIHSIELSLKHQSEQYGLNLALAVTTLWNHDGDAIRALEVDRNCKLLKDVIKKDPTFFQKKVQKYFKNNPHRLTLIMSPDEKFEEERIALEASSLKSKVDSLTVDDKKAIYARGLDLLESQNKEESSDCLPFIAVNDVDKKIKPEILSVQNIKNVPVYSSYQPTNGVTYISMICDINKVPADLLPYMYLFSSVLTKLGAGDYDFVQFSKEEEQYTGGLHTSLHVVSHASQENTYEKGLYFDSYCLDKNVDKMLHLWESIFNGVHFHHKDHMKVLVNLTASNISNSIPDVGHRFAANSSASSLTSHLQYQDMMLGMPQVSFMKKIAELGDLDETIQKLKQIADLILNKESLRILIHTTPENMSTVEKSVKHFISDINGKPTATFDYFHDSGFKASSVNTQYELPFSVNYVAKSYPTVTGLHPDSSGLQVLANILSTKFLHREIREKGGAYGGGAGSKPQVFNFISYRDPNSFQTIETFDRAVDWISQSKFTDKDIEEAKLSVFREIDKPTTPSGKGLNTFCSNLTDEMRQMARDRIFSVNRTKILDVNNRYLLDNKKSSSTTFLGPANEQIKSRPEKWNIIKE